MTTRFAIIENGRVANVAEADAAFAEQQGWIACPTAAPGWLYADGVFSPPPPDFEAMARQARAQRDMLLSATDWRVIKATETGEPLPDEWASYRQALRDITLQPGFPESITWPTEPQ